MLDIWRGKYSEVDLYMSQVCSYIARQIDRKTCIRYVANQNIFFLTYIELDNYKYYAREIGLLIDRLIGRLIEFQKDRFLHKYTGYLYGQILSDR